MVNNYDVLISYDINTTNDSEVHSAIKNCMLRKGYADRLIDAPERKTVYLPNTTLWKQNINAAIARTDLQSCLDEYNRLRSKNHVIERCIALEFTSLWHAVYGVAHSSSSSASLKQRTA